VYVFVTQPISFSDPDLVRDVQEWIDNPQSNKGWLLLSGLEEQSTPNNSVRIQFNSRENAQGSPSLTIFLGNPNAPKIFVNGDFVEGSEVDVSIRRNIVLESPYHNGSIFYTLDGTPPTLGSQRYTSPFFVANTGMLRVVTVSEDYSQLSEESAVKLNFLPLYGIWAGWNGDGSVTVNGINVTRNTRWDVVESGTVVHAEAVPGPGYTFGGWTGDVVSASATADVRIVKETSLIPNFVPVEPNITIRRVQNDWILIEFSAASSRANYVVQSSTAFANWQNEKTFSGTAGKNSLLLPLMRTGSPSFYRILAQ
jgi:hypothetical protein